MWEIRQKRVIEMAAERGPFIDQSQSLNIHMGPSSKSLRERLSSALFDGWRLGLKTGMYYLRTKSSISAKTKSISEQNTDRSFVDMTYVAPPQQTKEISTDGPVCTMNEGCLSCGS